MDNLIKYRMESAKERLKSSKLLLDAGQYKNATDIYNLISAYLITQRG